MDICLSLSEIGKIVGGEVAGDGNKNISGAAGFNDATANDITFAVGPKFLKQLDVSKAGAIIVPKSFSVKGGNLVKVDNPKLAFIKILEFFNTSPKKTASISSSAYMGENFNHGKNISMAGFVHIGDNVSLGDSVTLYPGVVIEDNVKIGSDVKIYPNVTILERCIIGSRIIIHAGTVIGSDGFGFVPDGEKYHKIPHLGIVQIDDDVEIGAGNTIDRGTFGKTRICRGVKTDNLVHVGHNVIIGENSIIVAQVGISGSVTIGKHTIIAGQAGISGHLSIGDNVTVGPRAGVAKSIKSGETVSGTPTMPHKLWLRIQNIIPRLPELKKKLKEIEKRLIEIEKIV